MMHLLLICLLALANSSQNELCDCNYTEQIGAGSEMIECGPYHTVEETVDGKHLFQKYYPTDKTVVVKAFINSGKERILHGYYQEFYDDGSPLQSGMYAKGVKVGKWLENEHSTGFYLKGRKQGTWLTRNAKGELISEANYLNGELHGRQIHYGPDSLVLNEEIYLQGVYVERTAGDTLIVMPPMYKGCEQKGLEGEALDTCATAAMRTKIYNSIKYPLEAKENEIHGTVLLRFTVGVEGEISNVKVLKKVHPRLEQEAIKVIPILAKKGFLPATRNGVAYAEQYSLPIKFKLEYEYIIIR